MQKSIWQNPTLNHGNTFSKLGTEGKLDKEHPQKPTANIILNGKRLKAFPLRSGKGILILVSLFPREILTASRFLTPELAPCLRGATPWAGTWSPLVVEQGIAIPEGWAVSNLWFQEIGQAIGSIWQFLERQRGVEKTWQALKPVR